MDLKTIIRSSKEDIVWGQWQSGKVPRKEFPLSKARQRHYSVGSRYKWRICRFAIRGQNFRVWVLTCPDLEQYRAYLGLEQAGDMVVMARYEFHGTHPGWHVHAACENVREVMPGRTNSPLQLRYPGKGKFHRDKVFGVNQESAADRVIKRFRILGPGALL